MGSGKAGPCSVPALRDLNHTAADVKLADAHKIQDSVASLLQQLLSMGGGSAPPDVGRLSLAHPADVASHAAHLQRCPPWQHALACGITPDHLALVITWRACASQWSCCANGAAALCTDSANRCTSPDGANKPACLNLPSVFAVCRLAAPEGRAELDSPSQSASRGAALHRTGAHGAEAHTCIAGACENREAVHRNELAGIAEQGSGCRAAGLRAAIGIAGTCMEADASATAEASADLQRRWSSACSRLRALPTHERFAQLLPYAEPVLQQGIPSLGEHERLKRCHIQATDASVVIQIALHAPDAQFTKSQTLLARSDHTLAELKDALACANDRHARDELGRALCGGMFYLSETLFPDTRSAGQQGHVDYETNVRAFLQLRAQSVGRNVSSLLLQRGLGRLTSAAASAAETPSAAMQSTPLSDLVVSIARSGQYLYVHAGACEHVVVFEDVRLLHSDDPDVSEAPASLPLGRARLEKCCICSIKPAVKMAFDDKLAPESPAFFCAQCFDDLHLDVTGRVLSDASDADVFEMYG